MRKVITITGQRGGSGKSVAAVNIAASLAVLEKKTLLIDCDPQANATAWSGIKSTSFIHTLPRVLSGKSSLKQAIYPTCLQYLDTIPAGFDLLSVSLKLSGQLENQKILRILLSDVLDTYEYIIIDTPSSYSYLTLTALTAADFLLVSMCPDLFTKKDLQMLLAAMQYIHRHHGISLTIAGFLKNRFETDEKTNDFLAGNHLKTINSLIFYQGISDDITVKNALANGVPVCLHHSKCPAARDYIFVARELDLIFNKRGVL